MALSVEILDKTHIRNDFECGNFLLDNYIKTQAGQDVKRDLSVCYILSDNPGKMIAGYYTLSSNSIKLEELPEELRSKLPRSYKDIPTALIGRLAVSKKYQGQRLGAFLLADALKRCAALSESIGTLAVMVDPIDENAANFYSVFGFVNLPDSDRMFIPVKTIRALQAK